MGIFRPWQTAVFLVFLFQFTYAFTSLPHRPFFGIASQPSPLKLSSTTAINARQQNTTSSSPPSLGDATATVETPVTVQRTYETYLWKRDEKEYKINYRVEGPADGPPVLLVHGFGANVNHFRYQFPALREAGYRVYAVDLIGFGASDKPADVPYSIELFVEILRDFCVHHDTGKEWIFCGNSIGGLCSLGLARELKSSVKGIVLFNCAGGMTGFRYEDLPLYLHPFMFFLQKVVLGPFLGGSFFANFKTRENVESILKGAGVYRDIANVDEELMQILLGPSDDEGAKDVFLKVFAGPPGPTPESILPDLKEVPILLLWGDSDPWTPYDGGMHGGSKFGAYHDKIDVVLLPGAGHCPHDECPDAVNQSMLPWMKQLESS